MIKQSLIWYLFDCLRKPLRTDSACLQQQYSTAVDLLLLINPTQSSRRSCVTLLAVNPNAVDDHETFEHKYSSSEIYNAHPVDDSSLTLRVADTFKFLSTMSPRKNMKKRENRYPPAPSAEDEAASPGYAGFAGISQDVIDKYLAAYDALDELSLEDDGGEYVSKDASEDSQSTPGGYEQEQSGENRGQILFLRKNGSEPPLQHRVNYRTIVDPPQRAPAPVQQNPVPVAPPSATIFRNAANPAFTAGPNVPQAEPVWYSVEGIPEAIERYDQNHRRHRRLALPFHGKPFEEHYLRASAPGRYSRGIEGMPRDFFPSRSVPIMRRPNGRQDERMPFAPPRPLDRDMAPPMERDLLFEMWADAFVESRRMEQDMAAFRQRLERLYKFNYRSQR